MRSGKTCNGPEKQAPKTYSNRSDCGPERHAAVRKSKHPKRTLIVDCGPERCSGPERLWSGKTCSGPEKQAPKTYSRYCRHYGPKDMQRSGKEDSTRQRWRQTEGERERERQRDRETERQREEEGEERESVVNGEQRVFQSGFRPLFVLRLPQLGEKTGKNGKRKKRREKERRDKATTQNVL